MREYVLMALHLWCQGPGDRLKQRLLEPFRAARARFNYHLGVWRYFHVPRLRGQEGEDQRPVVPRLPLSFPWNPLVCPRGHRPEWYAKIAGPLPTPPPPKWRPPWTRERAAPAPRERPSWWARTTMQVVALAALLLLAWAGPLEERKDPGGVLTPRPDGVLELALIGSPVVFKLSGTGGGGGAFARKPTDLATPARPIPLRIFYLDFVNGLDSRTVAQAQNSATPWKTINKTKSVAIAGDCFVLAEGTTHTGSSEYVGGATQHQSGNATNYIQYIGAGTSVATRPTINGGAGGSGAPPVYFESNQSYYWFHNIRFQPASGTDGNNCVGHYYQGAHHITYTSITLANGRWWVHGSSDNRVYDFICTGNAVDQFVTWNGSNRNIFVRGVWQGTSSHSAGLIGLLFSASDADCTDNRVHDCDIQNTTSCGFSPSGKALRAVFDWNHYHDCGTVSGTSRQAIQSNARETVFRFNKINDCYRGIELQSYYYASFLQTSSGGLYHNNTMFNITSHALQIWTGQGVTADTALTGNTISSNIFWLGNQGSATSSNGFYEGEWFLVWIDTYQSNSGNGGSPYTVGFIGNNAVKYNLIGRGTAAAKFCIVVRNTGNTKHTLASFQSTYTGCSNNIQQTDPLLTNPGAEDFSLQAGSPCIDTGEDRDVPSMYGAVGQRWLGAGVDMGVLERGGGDT